MLKPGHNLEVGNKKKEGGEGKGGKFEMSQMNIVTVIDCWVCESELGSNSVSCIKVRVG